VVPALRVAGVDADAHGWLPARIGSVGTALLLGADLSARLLVELGLATEVDPVRWQIARVGAVVSTLMIGALTMRARAARREDAVRREAERARLQALQARTDPHFLYNALNTVAALIPADPRAAEDAVLRLSDLFRYVLDGARRERVGLGQELAAVDDYLGIEGLRLGERLRVVRAVEAGAAEASVVPLLLQPLVENAVRHGVATRSTGGTVTVRVHRTGPGGERLELVVEDDGPGHATSPGSGTSQADLARRLALVYGDRASFEAGPRPDGGYRARIVVPWESA
jgi:two-component system sensor histidine kinase AlgZ